MPRRSSARSTATRRTGRSDADRAEGRRLDALRLLDLLRRAPRRGQPGRPAQDRLERYGWRRVGLCLARQPAHPLQPGLGRAGRRAVVGAQEARSGGTMSRASGPASTCRTSRAPSRRTTSRPWGRGAAALAGDKPFIMQADGLGWIFVPEGLEDGPLPAHYEPWESPVGNPLSRAAGQPDARQRARPDNVYTAAGGPDPRFPYVLTTYRLTEHHTAGAMSPLAVASRRAAARAVLRDLAGAGRRPRHRAWRMGHDRHRAGRSRPGDGHQAHARR